MAGEQSLPRTQVQERQADAMWKHLAGEISSGPFVEHQQPGKQTRDSGSWNISPGPYSDNRDLLFQSMSAAAAAGNMNMMNTVLLPESSSHGGFFGSSSELWSGVEGSDRQTGMPIISAGLAEFMEIDGGFDSPYMSFTECLQAGLQMDASDYSRSLGQTAAGGAAPFDFSSPLTAEERAEAEAEAGAGAGAGSGHLGDTPNVPTTPVSSISSSSTEAIEDQEPSRLATVASTSGAKGGAAVPQAPGDQESLDKPSPQSKKQSKPRKKGQKRNREPRFAFMTKSDVDHLEDGYRWRKYGQKAVKNSPYPRSYYRCTNAKCSVKKRVERSFEDPSIVITTYEGQHTHQSPALLRSSGGEGAAAHMAERSSTANASLPPFTQSSLGFSLQMMAPRTTAAASFDPGHMQQAQAQAQQQQQQEQETDLQSSQRHMISAVPPPHPALLQQRSQPQAAAAVPNPTDQGLLEDIVPSGMRKLS